MSEAASASSRDGFPGRGGTPDAAWNEWNETAIAGPEAKTSLSAPDSPLGKNRRLRFLPGIRIVDNRGIRAEGTS
jgi:hypothetical protein